MVVHVSRTPPPPWQVDDEARTVARDIRCAPLRETNIIDRINAGVMPTRVSDQGLSVRRFPNQYGR